MPAKELLSPFWPETSHALYAFCGALLIISKPKLLAAHHPSPDLDFAPILTQVAWASQDLPYQSMHISIVQILQLL